MKYKQKSLISLKKRIKVTARGKYRHAKCGKKHLQSSKSKARKRKLSHTVVVDKTFEKKMQRLLPKY
jgi:large subunit ribosomal protein L35